jgi:hypothetical protein
MPCGGHGTAYSSHQALLAQLLVEQRTLGLPQLDAFVVAVGQEGQGVGAEDLPLVAEVADQHLADLRLAPLHRALDLGRLEQGDRWHAR